MTNEPAPSNARRREILDAAAAVFAEKGYHGTGMRDIADRLGMKAGSLYFHLESKDAALEEICAEGIRSALRSAEIGVSAGKDLATRIRALVAAQIEDLKTHSDYVSVFVHERRQLSAGARDRVVDISKKQRLLLDRIFDEAKANGELADNIEPRSARYFMVGALRNLTQLYVEGPIRDFESVALQSVEMLLSGCLAPGARPV